MKLINYLAFILASSFIVLLAFITHKWYSLTYNTVVCNGQEFVRPLEGDFYEIILKISLNILIFNIITFFLFYLVKYISKVIREKA